MYNSVNLLILKTNNQKTIQNGLRIVRKEMPRKHRCKYIVIIETIESFEKNWLKTIFKSFWDKNVLDVIIIYRFNGIINIFEYTPFIENRSQTSENDVHVQNVSTRADNEHFSEKLNNLQGYHLTAAIGNSDNDCLFDHIELSRKIVTLFGER